MRLLQYSRTREWFAFFVTDTEHFRVAIGRKRTLTLTDAQGAFDRIDAFWASAECPLAGYLGYDLKNDVEDLSSHHTDALAMPEACLFEPQLWVDVEGDDVVMDGENSEADRLSRFLDAPYEEVSPPHASLHVECLTDRDTYLRRARSLLHHIRRGDIYEVNYCVQFLGTASGFDPHSRFVELQARTEAPFSVFAKLAGRYVLSASPERFLRYRSGELISQPIKGTAKRSADPDEDRRSAQRLRHDPKERSENVMIVDLVRNDLSRVAARDTVRVEELFGVYAFRTVHHMISTVRARLHPKRRPMDAIRACFPPGSMTGAPKISAMNLIESHENFKRGCYAGSFGRFEPTGDFDLNVVIRTLVYNPDTQTVGFAVGSALTALADPEREYEECLLKAEALLNVLHGTPSAKTR